MHVSAAGFQKVFQYADMFKEGMLCTVYLSFFTVLLGFLLALVLTGMRMSDIRPFRALGLDKDGHLRDGGFLLALSKFNPIGFVATAYVEVIRATPMLVQLFIVYQVVFNKHVIDLPSVTVLGFLKLNRFLPGVIALALNSGAYVSEIIRAGIQSVDGGQTEAARSLGLTQGQNMRFIVLPQAVKNILPALGNEFVSVIKETSMASTFFVGDLMTSYLKVKGTTYWALEALLIVAAIYFILGFGLSKLISVFERRMNRK